MGAVSNFNFNHFQTGAHPSKNQGFRNRNVQVADPGDCEQAKPHIWRPEDSQLPDEHDSQRTLALGEVGSPGSQPLLPPPMEDGGIIDSDEELVWFFNKHTQTSLQTLGCNHACHNILAVFGCR